MRKIFETVTANQNLARVYSESYNNEFVVRFYSRASDCSAKHLDASDYFTSDKRDAIQTALYHMRYDIAHDMCKMNNISLVELERVESNQQSEF